MRAHGGDDDGAPGRDGHALALKHTTRWLLAGRQSAHELDGTN